MIQRPQTVFLALAAVLNGAVFFNPIFDKAMQDPQLWIGYGFALALSLTIVMSVASIFKYADRKNHIKWVKITMIPQLIALAYAVAILFSLGGVGTYLWDEAIGTALVLLGLLFMGLSIKFIKKDLELVRSIDRIR